MSAEGGDLYTSGYRLIINTAAMMVIITSTRHVGTFPLRFHGINPMFIIVGASVQVLVQRILRGPVVLPWVVDLENFGALLR